VRDRWPVWSALGVVAAGVAVLLAGPPVWLVDRLAAAFPGCLYRVRTHDRVVALTLDDGPDDQTTPLILAELRRQGARATFFLIGERVPGREALVRRLVEEGHELGNHFMHDRPAIRLSAEELARDLDQSHALLAAFAKVRWARPGSGWYSRETVVAMSRKGYGCALGSVYPYDATIPSSAFAGGYILRNVRPGAVIVLHDGGGRGQRTVRMLATVLPELRRRGYRLVTLSELALAERTPPRHRGKHGRRSTPNLDDPPPAGS
jgi:peptidoglycan/xylan/chitin deacetylase (PgdA/CDA1 family)